MKRKSAFINVLTVLIMLAAVFFTFSAAVYAKSDGSSMLWAYVMLYCGSFLPPVIWNVVIKFVLKGRKSESRFVDITQLSVSVIALAILVIWGSQHDIWLMIPWNLLIISSLVFLITNKKRDRQK